ncbi:hypothetical protein [Kineococcus terrestris]|uniref:hypothetical protein n=1 Tax=Kineococcus terrestris TaxID=2044856 RepID=UPI0034DAC017
MTPVPRRRRWHERPVPVTLVLLLVVWTAAHLVEVPSALWGLPVLAAGVCSVSLRRRRRLERARRRTTTSA